MVKRRRFTSNILRLDKEGSRNRAVNNRNEEAD